MTSIENIPDQKEQESIDQPAPLRVDHNLSTPLILKDSNSDQQTLKQPNTSTANREQRQTSLSEIPESPQQKQIGKSQQNEVPQSSVVQPQSEEPAKVLRKNSAQRLAKPSPIVTNSSSNEFQSKGILVSNQQTNSQQQQQYRSASNPSGQKNQDAFQRASGANLATATSLESRNNNNYRSGTAGAMHKSQSVMSSTNDLRNHSKGFSTSSRFFGTQSQVISSQENEAISASTLRFSSTTISFTKAERFSGSTKSYLDIAQYQIPSLLDKKHGTSFGYGEKRILPDFLVKNAITNPSPAKYASHIQAGSHAVSRTFGIPHRFYAKTYIPNVSIKDPSVALDVPGVGTYEVMTTAGIDKLHYSISGKGKLLSELFPSCSPPCNQYTPKNQITLPSRFSKTSFGFGNKYDFTKSVQKTPGPGAYIMPSAFDRFKKSRRANKSLQTLE